MNSSHIKELCPKCGGKDLSCRTCRIFSSFIGATPNPKFHFSGKSAPELFVGRIGYPIVNQGILAPSENDNVSNFATAEDWSKNNFSIENVLRIRGQLVHGKTKSNLKSTNKIREITKELSMSSKPVSTEFFLKKKPSLEFKTSNIFQPMANPAPLQRVVLEENPSVPRKVDYLTSDNSVKATTALKELYDSKIKIDHLQKLLSIGLLGESSSRKMVPTRWSITATDDTIAKELLKKIRYYRETGEIQVFSGEFVGNYIEILFLPGNFAFEGIEVWVNDKIPIEDNRFDIDYEGFNGRKTYASNITGGYYAMRFPVTEYLEEKKFQSKVICLRKITKEYYTALGVGIVRETTRRALRNIPKKFDSINEALTSMQNSLEIPKEKINEISWMLNSEIKQDSLKKYF